MPDEKETETAAKVIDLMAALKESLQGHAPPSPDETATSPVTVDGVIWTRAHGRWWRSPARSPGILSRFAWEAEEPLLSRIAALEAEREEVTHALRALASHVARLGVNPTIPDLLAWHRARGATPRHTEGRDNG